MKIVLRSLLAFALGVIGAPAAYSQDAREILTRVSETYVNLKTYDFNIESHAVFEVGGVKYRMTMPQEMAQGDTPDEAMSLQFKRAAFVKLDGSDQPANPGISFALPSPGFYDFARITQNLQYEKLLREETLESNGVSSACYVVEILKTPNPYAPPRAPAASPEILWIDKSSYLVHRTAFHTTGLANAIEMDWDVAFTSYTLNEAPPQWIVDEKKGFDRRMAELSARWVGASAPGFALQDVDGRQVTMADLRDKVVLLDFWDTWCGPCRKELPVLGSLEKAWAPKGLIVVRITDEPPEDIQAFLRKTQQSFRTLVNGESVFKTFGVTGIPTLVLIDRGGKIVSYDVDALSEAELTARFKKAGLE
jgi:thiol-disulfide isomerase/thioredoxin